MSKSHYSSWYICQGDDFRNKKEETKVEEFETVSLKLSVLMEEGPYETTTLALVSPLDINHYQVGMVIPIKIHPKNRSLILVVPDQEKINRDLELHLMAINKENEQISTMGQLAKATILTYAPLGAFVNGNNPFVQLEVEVKPTEIPAFQATVKAVIRESSVLKFQPGKEVWVRFDPQNLNRVALERSI